MKGIAGVAVVLLCCHVAGLGAVGCMDENGNPVDWWVIMKVPQLPSVSTDQGSGFGYAYGDAHSRGAITLTNKRLDQNLDGALGSTLAQLYNADASSTAWISYNDQYDSSSHESYGHTKGNVVFNSRGGFWLVHSTPRFPIRRGDGPYSFPDFEKENGQSFLCMSLGIGQFDTVGYAFLLNKPYIYDSNMPSSLDYYASAMRQVLNGNFVTRTEATNATSIATADGQQFLVFSKNAKWGKDLYSELVEPYAQSGLLIETWMNGANNNKMPTFCTPQYQYDSINIRQVGFNDQIQWPETKDHSKWAVATDAANFFCIGDINRQFSQAQRGGGTVCGQLSGVFKSLKGMITSADSC